METSINPRRITFNDPSLFDDNISSDDDHFSLPTVSERSNLFFTGTDISESASYQFKSLPWGKSKLKDSDKNILKSVKMASTVNFASRATTARPNTARTKEYPIRLGFPVKKISISKPDGLWISDIGLKRFPEIELAISRPPTGHKSIQSRPETAFNISDWDSRPPTARFKEKKIEKRAPITRPVHQSVLLAEKGTMRKLFQTQREIEMMARDNSNPLLVLSDDQYRIEKLLNIKLAMPQDKVSPIQSISDTTSDFNCLSLLDDPVDTFMENESVSASFLIIRGHINQESEAFVQFLNESVEKYKISVSLTQYFLEKLQKFVSEYGILYAECVIAKIFEFLKVANAWKLINKHTLLSIMQKKDDLKIDMVGSRYRGFNRREIAATKIQSILKMYSQKKSFKNFKFEKKCAYKIITYLRERIKKRKRLLAQMKSLDLSVSYVKTLNCKFQDEWENEYVNSTDGRVSILLNSMSFSQKFRSRISNLAEQQKNNYGRLLQLLNRSTSVVFITPEMTTSDRQYLKSLISIHWDYQDLIELGRLRIIEVYRPSFFYHDTALITILLMENTIISSLSSIAGENNKIYLESLLASKEDCRLCEILKIPLYGDPDLAMEFLHNKIRQRRFVQEVGAQVPIGFIFPPKSLSMGVFKVFSDLVTENPHITIWIMKMNDYGDGEGLAFFSVPSDIKRPVKFTTDTISSNIQYISPAWNNNWKNYLKAFVTNGGVIEAFAPTKTPHYISYHMDITPSFQLLFTGSNSLIPGTNLLSIVGSIMPHIYPEQDLIHKEAALIGKALVKAKYVGPITVEFVCWKAKEKHLTTAWITSIKLFYTFTRDKFNLSKFIARDHDIESNTILQQPSPECFPSFSNLKKLQYFDTSNHFKRYSHNPAASDRVSMHLSNLSYTGAKFLSKESFRSFFIKADAVISKQGLGAIALVGDNPNASLLIIQKDLKSCANLALKCLLNIKKNVITRNETDNFLDVVKNTFRLLPFQKQEQTDLHTNFEEFAKDCLSQIDDGKISEDDDKNQAIDHILTGETIKLLAMDIPSQSLHLFDHSYGKRKLVRKIQSPRRIESGLYTPEEYLELMEKEAEALKKSSQKQMAR